MTNDTASPSLPPSSPARWRIPLAVGAAVLAVIVVTAVVVGSGDDDPPPGADDATSSAPTSDAPSAPESASPSPTDSGSGSAEPSVDPPEGDPTPSPVIDAAVKDAIEDGFPALVPSGVPAGWTVVTAAYVPKDGGRWTIVLTDPAGAPVTLAQTTAGVKDLVREQLGSGAQQDGSVDLGNFGTGTWKRFTSGEQVAIATTIAKRTSAVVVGIGDESPVAFAQQLLTAEDSDMPEAG